MGDIGSDTSSQLYMMRDAFMALRAKYPTHKLLQLASFSPDGESFTLTDAYFDKFVHTNDKWNVQGYARYTIAMEEAAKRSAHSGRTASVV